MKTISRGLLLLAAGLLLPLAQATFSGRATFYNVETGGPSSCGFINTNSDLVVSLSTGDYAGGVNCGRDIKASFGGASFTAKVVGECVGCGSHNIDLSPAAFQVLAPLSAGLISPVTWDFV